jgi:hypothetical protein
MKIKKGVKDLIKLLDGKESKGEINNEVEFSKYYADKLIELAIKNNFDGWFFNIECDIPNEFYVNKMILFLKYITKEIHKRKPNSLIIWYDSVIKTTGKIEYQNELNVKNSDFFDCCDGIFLNYCWKDENLKNSFENSKERNYDVFVGIDVWKRGCVGGFETYQSFEKIQKYNLSIAVFAPAWTYEQNNGSKSAELFYLNENHLWNGVRPVHLLLEEWEFGNDDKWTIEKDGIDDKCYVTSFNLTRKSQKIDLYKHENQEFWRKNPIIECIEWCKGTGPNFNDYYFITISLFDENNNLKKKFEKIINKTCEFWKKIKIQINLNDYENIQYILYENGGKDIENWFGNFGSRISVIKF